MNIWFTSDEHVNHKNLIRGTSEWPNTHNCRDFPSLEAHNEHLIQVTNEVVKPEDIIYHMGDVMMGPNVLEEWLKYRARLNCCNIYLVFGNHDYKLKKALTKIFPSELERAVQESFVSWYEVLHRKIGPSFFVLNHYCQLTWPFQNEGSIHLHGHSHGTMNYPETMQTAKVLDVGRDVELYGHKKYYPWHLDEILTVMKTKDIVTHDHHGRGVPLLPPSSYLLGSNL